MDALFSACSRIRVSAAAISTIFTLMPNMAHSLTFGEVREVTELILYGAIGFFGALAFGWFLGGWGVYVARRGQEYRLEGLYSMVWGVRILFAVVCAVIVLTLLERW